MTGAPPATDDDLRLVLFGRTAAGKSSLLRALAQCAVTHQDHLGGKLEDLSGGLAEPVSDRAEGEVVPYPIRFQPNGPGGQPYGAVLLDCDGAVASHMLKDHQTLDEGSPEGTLACEVSDADTLLLVLDASEPPANLEAEFDAFGRFLRAMRKARGERAEVAGLPVFLVLTKCDLLAEPGDSAAKWMDRIEMRKNDADARFRAFLSKKPEAQAREDEPEANGKPEAQARDEEPLLALRAPDDSPFGRLDLHVWATATRRPAFATSAGNARAPYGVAELFRQCLTTARQYRQRYDRSERRVGAMVLASGLLLGVMAVLSVLLYFVNLTTRAGELQRRVEEYRFHDSDTATERLRASTDRLSKRQHLLQEIHDDEVFPRLSSESRQFVEHRLEELTSYLAYLDRVIAHPHPAGETTEEGLDKAIDRLRNDLAPPRQDWEDTRAAQIRRNWLESAEAMRKAVQAVRNWYLDGIEQAGRLWTFADYSNGELDWDGWATSVEKLVERMRKPPFAEAEAVPGVQGGGLTFLTVMRFDRVADARATWDLDRARLARVLNLACAVGLVTPTADRPAVLVFARDFTLATAKERLSQLKSAYPEYETTFVRDGLPEVFLPRLRTAARRQYEHLLDPARGEVLRHLRAAGRGEETAARWEALRPWLRQPQELADWRELARVLARLIEAGAPDPVTALQEFLARSQFELKLQSIAVEIAELRGLKPRAEGRLLVHHANGERQQVWTFEPAGEPTLDSARRVRVYTYRLTDARPIVYRAGDRLWAELPLAGGKERLVWSQSRSALYQFERLRTAPRLQSSEATSLTEGRIVEDVRLVPRPEDGLPAVPDLMPQVKLAE